MTVIAKFLLARDAKLPDLTDAAYSDIEHDREVFQTLVKRGADIHAEGFRNYTALDYATLRGHKQTEQWLKAAGVTSGRELKQREVPEKVLHLTQNNGQSIALRDESRLAS